MSEETCIGALCGVADEPETVTATRFCVTGLRGVRLCDHCGDPIAPPTVVLVIRQEGRRTQVACGECSGLDDDLTRAGDALESSIPPAFDANGSPVEG